MLNVDEESIICDLAEVYNIYDYRSLSCKKIATFSCGLRDDSRIKKKLKGVKLDLKEMLLASIVDNTRILAWLNSRDGRKGINRPESVLAILTEKKQHNNDVEAFSSGEEFEREWKRLMEGGR